MRILIALMLLTHAAFGQNPVAPTQGPPPRNLAQRADGRFSANTDPANPENFEVYTVVAGDTLSQIAGRVLNNLRLWPQLWEQNEHIVNPHWIYPNDKVLIRPITRITEAVPPPPPAASANPGAPGTGRSHGSGPGDSGASGNSGGNPSGGNGHVCPCAALGGSRNQGC